MPSYVALLRAVNLAGRNMVAMADLRSLAEAIGLEQPRTLLQSGNLVFQGSGASSRVERSLREASVRRLGVEIEFFVRTAEDWRGIVAGNPFPREAKSDPGRLVVMVFAAPVGPAGVTALKAAIPGRETVRAAGRHAYIVYPDGIGRSKLTTALIERKLEARGTGRNWNTVLKIAAMLESS